MKIIEPLPKIMVAPNGSRLTRFDHPEIPVTIEQTVETAKSCFAAGADGIHAHVRDAEQKHVLDAGMYRELMKELSIAVPDMSVQITTEAVGKYVPDEQRSLVRSVMPSAVSISVSEIFSAKEMDVSRDFFHWCADNKIAVQHIIYRPVELDFLAELFAKNIIPETDVQLLFVLGRYSTHQISEAKDVKLFVEAMKNNNIRADWAVCAFGQNETKCLKTAVDLGGKVRLGFENNLINEDGTVALNNAERVTKLLASLPTLSHHAL